MSETLGELIEQPVVLNIFCKTCGFNHDVILKKWIELYGRDKPVIDLVPLFKCTTCEKNGRNPKDCDYRLFPKQTMDFPLSDKDQA